MKESRWRLQFRPKIKAMLAEIPVGTPEAEIKRLLRGRGPTITSHLPKMWRKELAAQLDARFDRTRYKSNRPIPRPVASQLALL